MDELELLKKDWQKDTVTYPRLSATELYKMIHSKSSSIVKWIFIISLIEIGLGLILTVINPNIESQIQYPGWTNWMIYATYPVILFFVYRFYQNYKNISATDDVKSLISNIIKTRRTVKHYVWFNVIAGGLIAAVGLYIAFTINAGGVAEFNANATTKEFVILIVSIIIALGLVIGIILGIYYLLYGLLLRRLNRNYKELKKLES